MKPTSTLYYKYAGVITSVVNHYAIDCPSVRDELFLEAQLVFCQACLTYDPNHESGASFETWLRQKLQAITYIIKKATRGPNMIKLPKTKEPVNNSVVTVSMLAQNISKLDDEDPVDISDATPNWYLEEYGKKNDLGTGVGEFPMEMQPYIKALKGDSLRIFQDFCRGKFNLKPQKFMTIAKKKAREVLNPNRLHRRVYMQEGWSLERVKVAWRGLSSVFRNYINGQLPCMVISKERQKDVVKPVCNEPVVVQQEEIVTKQPRKESRSSVWYFGFEKRHGITYGMYRNLVKRGVIPRLKKGEDNLDLSYYRVMAY